MGHLGSGILAILLHVALKLIHGVFGELVRIDTLIVTEALQDVLLHIRVQAIDLVVLA